MYKKTLTKVSERYEAPSIEVLSVSMEGVLCQSGGSLYNQYGLHDMSGSDVVNDSEEWN